jgi:hypothetical protein
MIITNSLIEFVFACLQLFLNKWCLWAAELRGSWCFKLFFVVSEVNSRSEKHWCYSERKLPPSPMLMSFRVCAFAMWNLVWLVFIFWAIISDFSFLHNTLKIPGMKVLLDWDQHLSFCSSVHLYLPFLVLLLNTGKFVSVEGWNRQEEKRQSWVGTPLWGKDLLLGRRVKCGVFESPFPMGTILCFCDLWQEECSGVHGRRCWDCDPHEDGRGSLGIHTSLGKFLLTSPVLLHVLEGGPRTLMTWPIA